MREKKGIRLMAAVLCLAVLCASGAAAEQKEEVPHDRCIERAIVFLYYWSAYDFEGMIPLCAPSWKASLPENQTTEQELWTILTNRLPVQYHIESCQENGENCRILKIWAVMGNYLREPDLELHMLLEDNEWYADPRSLVSTEATPAPEAKSGIPTQPPTPPVDRDPDRVLYYNPQGGVRYHADPYCKSISDKYLPLTNSFTYSQLGEEPYDALDPCPYCGAPFRQP